MELIKGSPEYIEFRRKANLRSKKYDSKPEVKARKKIYKKKHDIENKDKISKYGYELRARQEYKERVRKWREENKEHLKEYRKTKEAKARKKISDRKYYLKFRSNPINIKIDKEKQSL